MQQALKRAEAEALSAHSAATQGDNALREELKAIRQGLEQRLRAEVDEATAESIGRLTERFEAVAMTAGESDAKLRREIDTLRSILDADVKAPLAALQTTSKQALEIATGTQKTVSTFRKTGTMLQERVTAAERQIGAIKYPDAPDVFVFFGHHKCGSRFFRNEVFGRIAESTGARVRSYKIANPPHHYSRLDDLDLPNIDFFGPRPERPRCRPVCERDTAQPRQDPAHGWRLAGSSDHPRPASGADFELFPPQG